MIESIMIAAIGFLAAALLALLIIPAVNARAERLARRRVEALFPLSISELTAEKDHLRAEFAVTQRRIEQKAEEALASKRQDMEELGRRAVRLEALTTDLSARDGRIAGLEGELADTRGRLARTEEELSATRAGLASARETLAALEGAHRATLDELGATRGELEATKETLAEARTQLSSARDALAAREAGFRDLEARHGQSLAELGSERARVADLERRLATETVRGDEFERVAAERRTEVSVARQRLADLSQAHAALEERSATLEGQVRSLTTERDARASEAATAAAGLAALRATRDTLIDTLDSRVDELRAARKRLAETEGKPDGRPVPSAAARPNDSAETSAETAALQTALATARADRERLEGELASLRASSAGQDAIRAENAELRRRIDEVADQIMRAAEASAADEAPQRAVKRPATA